jgi:hypothetical protein
MFSPRPQRPAKTEFIPNRPADKSLAAYRNWIKGIVQKRNPAAKDTMTEEEWETAWRKFWSRPENSTDSPAASAKDSPSS